MKLKYSLIDFYTRLSSMVEMFVGQSVQGLNDSQDFSKLSIAIT